MNEVMSRKQQLSDSWPIPAGLEDLEQTTQVPHMQEAEDSDDINKKRLALLIAREAQLQANKGGIVYPMRQQARITKDAGPDQESVIVPPPPPTMPAPRLPQDPKELTTSPSLIQCPTCHEVIMTETVHRVGDTAWLACIMCSLIGGVAGCCLLPFCTKTFKDVVHKCPKCGCDIHTFSKL